MIIPTPTIESLDNVPAHRATPEIERWVFPGAPHLVSVHSVDADEPAERHYCEVHTHRDVDESNLLLGITPDFRFQIQVGCEVQVLGPHAAVFIPAGTPHSANVISGKGFFVVHQHPRGAVNPL